MSPAPADGIDEIDISGITFGGGTFGNFGVTPNATAFINGSFVGVDAITGSTGNDIAFGLAGSDTASLGDGDDWYLNLPSTGNDVVNGGIGSDTVLLLNITPPSTPSASPITFAVTAPGTDTVEPGGTTDVLVTMNAGAAGSVTFDNTENLTIVLGDGGDTVNITGDFAPTALETVTVTGGPFGWRRGGHRQRLRPHFDPVPRRSTAGGNDTADRRSRQRPDRRRRGQRHDQRPRRQRRGRGRRRRRLDHLRVRRRLRWIDGGEGGETALGDTLTVNLDNGGAGTSGLTGTVPAVPGDELSLLFDDAATTTVTDAEKLVINADADGSTVTLSGDLAATGITDSTVTFNGGPANDVFNGSGVTSTTTLALNGSGGNDSLTGGAGNDPIDGGANDDHAGRQRRRRRAHGRPRKRLARRRRGQRQPRGRCRQRHARGQRGQRRGRRRQRYRHV